MHHALYLQKKGILCFHCRHAAKHNQCSLSTKGEGVFSLHGFDNYKEALDKFQTHEASHREAVMKWNLHRTPPVQALLCSRTAKGQLS